MIYEMVADMDVGAANDFIQGFNLAKKAPLAMPQSVSSYILGFNEARTYGKLGIPYEGLERDGRYVDELFTEQKKIAYNRGKLESVNAAKYARDVWTSAPVTSSRKEYKGETHISKLKYNKAYKSLSEPQKTGIDGMAAIYKALGIDVYFFESPTDEKGRRIGKNGYFDFEDGSVHIDLYAGIDGKGTILFAAAHELTHFIRAFAPEKFKVFADILFERYEANGASVAGLIWTKIEKLKKNGRTGGKSEAEIYDLAYEEVVADACEAMLANGDAFAYIANKVMAEDKGLWQAIKDFFTRLVARIKAAYEGLIPDSEEGRLVSEMLEKADELRRMWTDMLVEAGEYYSAVGRNEGSQANENDNNGIRFSYRYQADERLFNPEGRSLDEQLDNILHTAESFDGRYLYVGRFTSNFIETLKPYVKIKDLPIAMNYRHAYLSMESKEHGKYKGDGINYHDLGKEGLKSAIESFGRPEQVLLSNKDGKIELILQGMDYKNRQLFSIFEVNTKTQNNRKFMAAHVVASVYGNRGLKNRIITAENEGRVIYKKEEESTQVNPQVQYKGIVNANSSNRSIPQSDITVNSQMKKYSDRDPESVSDRAVLADALELVAENGRERNLLRNYKTNLRLIASEQQRLRDVISEMNGIRFKKSLSLDGKKLSVAEFEAQAREKAAADGKSAESVRFKLDRENGKYIAYVGDATEGRLLTADKTFRSREDMERLAENEREAKAIENRIDSYDRALLGIEAMAPIRDIIKRERERTRREALTRGNEALDAYRERISQRAKERLSLYKREYRERARLRSEKAELKDKLRRVIRELDGLLNRGNKKRNVKDELRDTVSASLALADVLFNDDVSEEDIVKLDIGSVTDREAELLGRYRELLERRDTLERELEAERERAFAASAKVARDATKNSSSTDIIYENVLNVNRASEKNEEDINGLTYAEKGAIIAHKSGGSYPLNAKLIEGVSLDGYERELVNNLDNALDKLPKYKGVVYRNISFGDKAERDAYVAMHVVGETIPYIAYTSSSAAIDGYELEGDFVVRHIIQSENGRNLSGYGSDAESEVLFARDTYYVTDRIEYDTDGTPTIYLKEAEHEQKETVGNDGGGATKSIIGGTLEVGYGRSQNNNSRGDEKAHYRSLSGYRGGKQKAPGVPDTTKVQRLQAHDSENGKVRSSISGQNTASNNDKRGKLREIRAEVSDTVYRSDIYFEADRLEQGLEDIKKEISALNYKLGDLFERERTRLNKTQADELVGRLTALYSELKRSENEYIRNAYNDYAAERLNALGEALAGHKVRDMTVSQLRELYDAFLSIAHLVENSGKLFIDGRTEELSEWISDTKKELYQTPTRKKDRWLPIDRAASALNDFSWNNLRPVDAFERLGSKTLERLFWDVVDAMSVAARDITEARDVMAEARKRFGYSKWNMELADTEYTTESGEIFKPSLADKLSIYALSRRDRAMEHMTDGGFSYDTGRTYKETKNGRTLTRRKMSATYRLTPADISRIVGSLTAEQRGYVDCVLRYLTVDLGEKGNEVSMTLYGTKLFGKKIYFPLITLNDYISSTDAVLSGTPAATSLVNSGFTNKTVPHANNPIVLRGFDDVVLEHIEKMANYHALAVPAENLRRVFDGKSKTDDGSVVSIKSVIGERFGAEAWEYFSQWLADVNGGVSPRGAKSPFAKLFSKAKATQVAYNLSVVAQQYFSIIRAMELIDSRYFIPFLNSKAKKSDIKAYAELKKYAPIAVIKEMGGFDVGVGGKVKEYIGYEGTRKNVKYAVKKTADFGMSGAELMDKLGWITIWRAVKAEVYRKSGLKIGTAEFYEACRRRFDEVVTKTQVFDSVASRSGYMRSKNDAVKYATAFMGEPTAIAGRIFGACSSLRRAARSGEKQRIRSAVGHLARTVTVIAVSNVLGKLAQSLIYGGRDDEEDEALIERWAKRFAMALAEDLKPYGFAGYLPFGRDIVSLIEGYSVERPDMQLIDDMIYSVKKVFDGELTFDDILSLMGSLGNFVGVSLKNIIREIKAAVNVIEDVFDDIRPTDIEGAFAEGFSGDERSKTQKLYEYIINGDNAKAEVIRKSYKDEKAYNAALRKTLRENDPRIREAAEARYRGDVKKYTYIAKVIIAERHFTQDIVVAAINAEVNAIKKEQSADTETDVGSNGATTDGQGAVSFYSASDINAAFERGDTAAAAYVIDELIKTKVANGMTESAAKSSLRSSMTSYWKPLYKEAYSTGNTAEKERIERILKASGLYGDASAVIKTCREWRSEKN